ncbi:MAG: RdgB/HAM1 family non-canonical purine NTP pyrophosphatase [Endomicrobiia bacterium]|nr:RdgB/HAM1 family non-canonical purine NTP pyrophosphatase [Endomicrobiia bacterium]
MIEIVVATKNPDKIREIEKLLAGVRAKFSAYRGASPAETGKTLVENAAIKALAAARATQKWSIADDTGLEVAALGGRPGVRSARFAGPRAIYEDNVKKLLRLMKGLPRAKRKAVFKTAVCIASPDGKVYTVEGRCAGLIRESPDGKNGFGYDPVFYHPPSKKTFARMTLAEKNRVSHRARAIAKAALIIGRLSIAIS